MPRSLPLCVTKGDITNYLDADPNWCKFNGMVTITHCYDKAPLRPPPECLVNGVNPDAPPAVDTPPDSAISAKQKSDIAQAAIETYTGLLTDYETKLDERARGIIIDQRNALIAYVKSAEIIADSAIKASVENVETKAFAANDQIEKTINTAIDTAKLITDTVVEIIPDAFDSLEGLATDATTSINTAVDLTLADFTDFAERATEGITTTLNDVNDQTLINYTRLGTATDNIITNAGQNVERVIDRIDLKTLSALDAVVEITDLTTRSGNTLLNNTINQLDTQYNRYITSGETTIQKNTTLIDNVILSLTNKLDDVTKRFIDSGETSLEVLDTIVNNLPKSVRDLTSGLIKSAEENIAKPLERSGERIADALGDAIASAIGADKNDYRNIFKSVVGVDNDENGIINKIIDSMLPTDGLNIGLRAVMFSLATPLIAWSTLQGIAAVNSQRIMHEYSVNNPSQLLTPADLVNALKRNNITQDKFETDLKRLGHYPEDIQTLAKLGRQLVDPQSASDLWLRKLFTDAQLKEALDGVGVNETDQAALREAAFYIPPINDLILMGVRDVFTNDIAEALGLFADFPEEIVEFSEKQGLSREWAERYWAAHWVLPSPTMGFDMFHRDIIDKQELELLLRALDIVPAWRDKIIELSYNPLTRVDVRRMHALGILDETEVNKSYRDIGYSPENADRLTAFTVAFNTPAEEREDPELKKLSRANILSFYKTKLLTREETIQQLVELNYSMQAAELFVDDIDYKSALRERKLIVDNIAAKFDQGVIDYSTAENELYKSGLTGIEVETALNDLLAVQENKIAMPGKADLLKFLASGIITQDIFTGAMQKIGYTPFWIDAYIKTTIKA